MVSACSPGISDAKLAAGLGSGRLGENLDCQGQSDVMSVCAALHCGLRNLYFKKISLAILVHSQLR